MVYARKRLVYWVYEKYAFIKMLLIFLILLCPLFLRVLKILFSRKYINKKHKKNVTVGFFHPNCNACTPQENVLWSAVKAIQVQYDNVQICIYTGDVEATSAIILSNVESKFNIKLQPNIKFVYLRQRKWIKKFAYLGSMWVGCEALTLLKPHIIIDTMGYGFVNPIFKYVGGCKVINYIHNPMVTMDKLKTRHVILMDNQYVVTRRSPSALGISKGIAYLYGWSGRAADIVMVNSSWSEENINSIWRCSQITHLVYPPIGLEKLMARADFCWDKKKDFQIINASEFKSENNHELILQALNKIKSKIKQSIMNKVCLVLINLSTELDESYVQNLKVLVKQLDLEDYVKIYPQSIQANHLEEELIKASFGIYAKADDHFGSDIIAGLAAGQIMIVHASGANKSELIETEDKLRNGYLAKSVEEYTQALIEALNLSSEARRRVRKAARKTAEQFSRIHFQKEFIKVIESFFESKMK